MVAAPGLGCCVLWGGCFLAILDAVDGSYIGELEIFLSFFFFLVVKRTMTRLGVDLAWWW